MHGPGAAFGPSTDGAALARWCADFDSEPRRGYSESNLKLVPFTLQLAMFLMSEGGDSSRRAAMRATLDAFVASPPERPVLGPDGDGVLYHVVSTLALQSSNEFRAARLALLRHVVAHAVRTGTGTAGAITAAMRPSLVVFATVNLLQAAVLHLDGLERPGSGDRDMAVRGDGDAAAVTTRMDLVRYKPALVLSRCQQVRHGSAMRNQGQDIEKRR